MSLRIKMVYLIMFLFFTGTFITDAYELPHHNLKDAIKQSKVLFVGRIISIQEDEIDDSKKKAIAKVKILKIFRGLDTKNKEIFLYFYSDTIEERTFPLNLKISQEILFLLNSNVCSDKKIIFNSRLGNSLDFAFEILVENISVNFKNRFLSKEEKILLIDQYRPKQKEWILKSEIK